MVQTVSVELNSGNESFRSDGRESFDIGDGWTLYITAKPINLAAGPQTLFHLADADHKENDNAVMLEFRGSTIRLLVVGSKGYGSPGKMVEYASVGIDNTWSKLAVTWSGGTTQQLKLYHNGNFLPVSNTIFSDPSVVMTDSNDKRLWIGENKDTFDREFIGRVFTCALYPTVHNAVTISGFAIAPQSDQSAAKHWWRFGLDSTTATGIGTDYGSSSTKIPLNPFENNITAADVVADFPT